MTNILSATINSKIQENTLNYVIDMGGCYNITDNTLNNNQPHQSMFNTSHLITGNRIEKIETCKEVDSTTQNIDFLEILGYNKETLDFNQSNHIKTRGRPKKVSKQDGITIHKQNSDEQFKQLDAKIKVQLVRDFNLLQDSITNKIRYISKEYKMPYKQVWQFLESRI